MKTSNRQPNRRRRWFVGSACLVAFAGAAVAGVTTRANTAADAGLGSIPGLDAATLATANPVSEAVASKFASAPVVPDPPNTLGVKTEEFHRVGGDGAWQVSVARAVNGVCLVAENSSSGVRVGSCASDDAIRRGQFAIQYRAGGATGGAVLLAGVVPDDVEKVMFSDGASVAASQNVWVAQRPKAVDSVSVPGPLGVAERSLQSPG